MIMTDVHLEEKDRRKKAESFIFDFSPTNEKLEQTAEIAPGSLLYKDQLSSGMFSLVYT